MKNLKTLFGIIALTVIMLAQGSCVINLPEEEDLYAPDTPTGLYTTTATSSSISLSWDSSSGARGYYVYRSSSYNGTYSQVGDTSSTSYRNTGLDSRTVYYYRVAAYNNAGPSSRSDYIYSVTLSDANNYITISGTPRVGQRLTATPHGSGWVNSSYYWGYASSSDATRFTFIGYENDSTYVIDSSRSGYYIRAFRRHPSGDWVTTQGNYPIYASNYIGPIR
jgi:hypothetical protein